MYLLYILLGILILGILVFVHELGHFLAAKFCGVQVLEFSIGFGKKIFSMKRGTTRYSIGVFPLGGYVRMLGDDPRFIDEKYENRTLKEIYNSDEIKDETPAFLMQDIEERPDAELELLNDRKSWFLYKSYWKKFLIVFAGPLFNILFAWFLAILVIFSYGLPDPINLPIIGDITKDSPAKIAGLKKGDEVLNIDNLTFKTWDELANYIQNSNGKSLKFNIKSENDELKKLVIIPEKIDPEMAAVYGYPEDIYRIGIEPQYELSSVPILNSIHYGFNYVTNISLLTFNSIYAMVSGKISAKHIGGPISIVGYAADSAKMGFEFILKFIIMLSVSLGLFNLFPIPVLDGGHLLIFTIEAVIRRRLGKKAYDTINQIGMTLIISLFLFSTGNDILKIVYKFI